MTSPIVIEEGHFEATGLINPWPTRPHRRRNNSKRSKSPRLPRFGTERTKERAASAQSRPPPNQGRSPPNSTQPDETCSRRIANNLDLGRGINRLLPVNAENGTITPGGKIAVKLRVERNGFEDRIAFEVANLPHGIIVDDIGLSGVLIPESKPNATIFLPNPGSRNKRAPSSPPPRSKAINVRCRWCSKSKKWTFLQE